MENGKIKMMQSFLNELQMIQMEVLNSDIVMVMWLDLSTDRNSDTAIHVTIFPGVGDSSNSSWNIYSFRNEEENRKTINEINNHLKSLGL